MIHRDVVRYIEAHGQIWQQLNAVQPHPIAKHFFRQLSKIQPNLPIFMLTALWGGCVMLGMVLVFPGMDEGIMLLLPGALVLFSSSYVLPWLYRITQLIQLQHRNAILDATGVIPHGSVFVTFVICHTVLNEFDRLGWLGLMRLVLTLIATICLVFAALLTLTQSTFGAFVDGVWVMLDIASVCLLFYAEHRQSILLMCYLAVILPRRASHSGHIVSNSLMVYSISQLLITAFTVMISTVIQQTSAFVPIVTFNILLFLLMRELLIFGLWRVVQSYD